MSLSLSVSFLSYSYFSLSSPVREGGIVLIWLNMIKSACSSVSIVDENMVVSDTKFVETLTVGGALTQSAHD